MKKEVMVHAKIGAISSPVLINGEHIAEEKWFNLWYDCEVLEIHGKYAKVYIPELDKTVWTETFYIRDKQK